MLRLLDLNRPQHGLVHTTSASQSIATRCPLFGWFNRGTKRATDTIFRAPTEHDTPIRSLQLPLHGKALLLPDEVLQLLEGAKIRRYLGASVGVSRFLGCRVSVSSLDLFFFWALLVWAWLTIGLGRCLFFSKGDQHDFACFVWPVNSAGPYCLGSDLRNLIE